MLSWVSLEAAKLQNPSSHTKILTSNQINSEEEKKTKSNDHTLYIYTIYTIDVYCIPVSPVSSRPIVQTSRKIPSTNKQTKHRSIDRSISIIKIIIQEIKISCDRKFSYLGGG